MSIQRKLGPFLREMSAKYPVLALTGPRQSGKTTLLKTIFQDYQYLSLENPDNRAFAQNDPNGFLQRYASKIIIDEAQQVPHLFSYIQTLVDESDTMGQFILSGSQNFHLMQEITQSLAGRVAVFKLFPFDIQEMKQAGILEKDYLKAMVKGFYPAIFDRNLDASHYYSNYIQTYLQRDVSELIEIKNQSTFKRFLYVLASRAGQLLNINSMANELDISQPTAKSWLSALESSYIIFLLQPYYENFSKRIVKTPKLYFYDSGLLSYLLKIRDYQELITHPVKGNVFENMVIAEYVKQIFHNNLNEDLWFWRDSHGNEVGLLYQKGQTFYVSEIKANQTLMPKQFKGLLYFETHANKSQLIKQLIYAGDDNQKRSAGNVMSWKDIQF